MKFDKGTEVMTILELTGNVNDEGDLEFDRPANLPPGKVRIIIETEDELADEALWDEKFAKTQHIVERLANEAHEDYLAGRTQELDPEDDSFWNQE